MTQHNRLANLPRHVLIDANVLLESTFVGGGGLVRTAVEKLRGFGFNPIVSIETVEEADRRLFSLSQALKLPYRPIASFHHYLYEDLKVEMVEKVRRADAQPVADLVSRADQHLVHAAIAFQAWVLTNELPFPAALVGSPVEVRGCWDVVLSNVLEPPPEHFLFRVAPRSADNGFIFARIKILPATGRHTIIEDPDLGWLYLDQDRSELAFQSRSGKTVQAPLQGNADDTRPVAFSFQRSAVGYGANLRTVGATRAFTLTEPLPEPSGAGYRLFHRGNGLDHMHGHVFMLSAGPGRITSETWRNLLILPERAPNPITSDVLATALSLARQRADGLYIVSEKEILRARYS